MRRDFYTICDRVYAARALALYRSLETVCPDFRLRVFCVDDSTKAVFDGLGLPQAVVIDLRDLEAADPELLRKRPTRTNAEYCWTAKASACLYAFQLEPDIAVLTYVDSDLLFFHDPAPLFEELGSGSILIVPHRNPKRLQWWDAWGVYNAGFVAFRRDSVGMSALHWWRERCLEWCYGRLENGNYADQTYLDDWPTRFPGTQVLEHVGGGLAPWNITESSVTGDGVQVQVDGLPLVFFHFATLRLYRDLPRLRQRLFPEAYGFSCGAIPLVWTIDRSYATIQPEARKLVWDPYVLRVGEAMAEIDELGEAFSDGLEALPLRDVLARTAPRTVLELSRRLMLAYEKRPRIGRRQPPGGVTR